MAVHEKFIVIPFRKIKGGAMVAGEVRPASSEASAVRLAEVMAERFAGTAALAVYVDMDTGEMSAPRLIREFGQTMDLISDLAA
ncbi:hypothetical protein [Ensifer soli]|uniref:hypothetical protein n=1 Tax=Ciceribacter sp. sgz301302 TaxID=3342379 RepID=UPI0035BAE29C